MQEFRDLLNNEHLLRFAGLFAIGMAPGWRIRHAEVASVRPRLDRLAQIVRGGECFDRQALLTEWVRLITDLVQADRALYYTSEDMDWFVSLLDGSQQHARTALLLLLATASTPARWYGVEELASLTNLSIATWNKRAALPENPWMAQKRGNRWFFHEMILQARGVALPSSLRIEEDTETKEGVAQSTLGDILRELDNSEEPVLLDDGAQNWDANNLLAALEATEEGQRALSQPAISTEGGIVFLKDDGYQESVPRYWYRREAPPPKRKRSGLSTPASCRPRKSLAPWQGAWPRRAASCASVPIAVSG